MSTNYKNKLINANFTFAITLNFKRKRKITGVLSISFKIQYVLIIKKNFTKNKNYFSVYLKFISDYHLINKHFYRIRMKSNVNRQSNVINFSC
ncbi:hypothetical protein Cst_c02040 [Thermoclostridium stercorarium subsp. stercorarium DSM 8532]|uniref:Uncharacterized protein n=1 Tax=Thermoclostridium stercorarium (strain ATCC 35414 / DSM 8532 / NCIMB 11754) TaxID=1121335 RepID=L7VNW8_THES1|nr:hypothetical protein Cst_c02040 [Thermoclostridium stercorarium subsp. stercorarium DSM 8532]